MRYVAKVYYLLNMVFRSLQPPWPVLSAIKPFNLVRLFSFTHNKRIHTQLIFRSVAAFKFMDLLPGCWSMDEGTLCPSLTIYGNAQFRQGVLNSNALRRNALDIRKLPKLGKFKGFVHKGDVYLIISRFPSCAAIVNHIDSRFGFSVFSIWLHLWDVATAVQYSFFLAVSPKKEGLENPFFHSRIHCYPSSRKGSFPAFSAHASIITPATHLELQWHHGRFGVVSPASLNQLRFCQYVPFNTFISTFWDHYRYATLRIRFQSFIAAAFRNIEITRRNHTTQNEILHHNKGNCTRGRDHFRTVFHFRRFL